jgi:hypothetical protein
LASAVWDGVLGASLFDVKEMEGFIVPWARPLVSGCNLVVFPQKLKPGSRVEYCNPHIGKTERLKP